MLPQLAGRKYGFLMSCFRLMAKFDNDYARRDIGMIEVEAGNYFNLVSIIATKLCFAEGVRA